MRLADFSLRTLAVTWASLALSSCSAEKLVEDSTQEPGVGRPSTLIGRGSIVRGGGFDAGGVQGFIGSLSPGWQYDYYSPPSAFAVTDNCQFGGQCGLASFGSIQISPTFDGPMAWISTSTFYTSKYNGSPPDSIAVTQSGISSTSIDVPAVPGTQYWLAFEYAVLTANVDPTAVDKAIIAAGSKQWTILTSNLPTPASGSCGSFSVGTTSDSDFIPAETFSKCHPAWIADSVAVGSGPVTFSATVMQTDGTNLTDFAGGTVLLLRNLRVEGRPSANEGTPFTVYAGAPSDVVVCDVGDAACQARFPTAPKCPLSEQFNNKCLFDFAPNAWSKITWSLPPECQALSVTDTPRLDLICRDDGALVLRLTGTQYQTGGSRSGQIVTSVTKLTNDPTPMTVSNLPPAVTGTSGPASAAAGASSQFGGTFTDPGTLDTHTAAWDWGDGSTSTATVTEANGAGTVANGHVYQTAGNYLIRLTVTDDNGGSASQTRAVVIAGGSSGGTTIQGSGTIEVPGSAYPADPRIGNLGTFNLACTLPAAGVPSGSVRLRVGAVFEILSVTIDEGRTLDWQVCRGNATINGLGLYRFQVSVVDRSAGDRFRLRLTDLKGKVVFDTEIKNSPSASPQRLLLSGGIVVSQ